MKSSHKLIIGTKEHRKLIVTRSITAMTLIAKGIVKIKRQGGVKTIHRKKLQYYLTSMAQFMGPE